jgi:hypothetical protein
MPGQVFISYCHNDGDFAENLASKLKDNGLKYWMDETALEGGDEWREEIDRSIRDSSVLVLVVTPESKDSFYVTYEWIFALGAGLKVVPVKLKKIEPHPRLRKIHHHDFTNRRARPWDKLIADLKSICDREHREESDTISAAKHVSSIEVPVNCPPIVEKAIMSLDSVNEDERKNAIKILSQCNFQSKEKILFSAMREHPLADVRSGIASELAQMGIKGAIPEFIKALDDISHEVRANAAIALGRIGDSAALPALIEALKDSNNGVRYSAAYALGNIGDSTAVPTLIEALKGSDSYVRYYAVSALGKIGNAAAVPGLIAATTDDDIMVQRRAVDSLKKIGYDSRGAISKNST